MDGVVVKYLRMVDAASKGMVRADMKYASIEGMVLDLGRSWTPQRRPARWSKKLPYGDCFKNAGRLALMSSDLTYAEGYALCVIPVLHAWVVDSDGRVIDQTWAQRDVEKGEYFGIPFETKWLRNWVVETGVWGVLGGTYSSCLGFLNAGFPEGAVRAM